MARHPETTLEWFSMRGEGVVFGGCHTAMNCPTMGTTNNQTWVWDGQKWEEKAPVGTGLPPSAREGHAMAYDSARGHIVLFGGYQDVYDCQGETWEWDGTSWTQVANQDDLGVNAPIP